MSVAFLFSGQGSQYVGMAKDLIEEYPAALKLGSIANQLMECNLMELCFSGPEEQLKETRYTQPALFLHSSIIMQLLPTSATFSAVAGHSLGEYSALCAAGVLPFEAALQLVKLRGELMYHAGEQVAGTMFAVVGLDDDKVEEVCSAINAEGQGIVVAANFNSPGQVVVSGNAELLRSRAQDFKAAGAKLVKELAVSGAFHSPLMEPARATLEQAIRSASFQNTDIPVYANVSAEPLTAAKHIQDALISQLTQPVRWTDTLRRMYDDGIRTFVEIGPGKVLQGLAKRTLPNDITIRGIDTAEQLRAYISSDE